MDGDIPDLPGFVEVKQRHKALLMIDEAHSLGVLGPTGRGIGEHFGVDRGDVDIWMGTFSKTFGQLRRIHLRLQGVGRVPALHRAGLRVRARPCRRRRRRPPWPRCGCSKPQPQRVARLRENARLFLALARAARPEYRHEHDSPVVPVILGNSIHCLRLAKAMSARGVNVSRSSIRRWKRMHPACGTSSPRATPNNSYAIRSMQRLKSWKRSIRAISPRPTAVLPRRVDGNYPRCGTGELLGQMRVSPRNGDRPLGAGGRNQGSGFKVKAVHRCPQSFCRLSKIVLPNPCGTDYDEKRCKLTRAILPFRLCPTTSGEG